MNIPSITRALELDDDDWELAVKLRGLTEHQREQFSTALGPARPAKKSSKKSVGKGGGGKSQRVSSLQQRIQATTRNLDGGVSKMRCVREGCGEYADHNVHHLVTYEGYHPFELSAGAPLVSGQSSTNSTGNGSEANSATEKDAAGVAHHGASGGD